MIRIRQILKNNKNMVRYFPDNKYIQILENKNIPILFVYIGTFLNSLNIMLNNKSLRKIENDIHEIQNKNTS